MSAIISIPTAQPVINFNGHHSIHALWERLRTAWLEAKRQQSGSPNTVRSYEHASAAWLDYCQSVGIAPWEATSQHARDWQADLMRSGLAASTVNQRLAACSSWYTFIIHERGLIDGVEVSAFMDRMGRTRSNPFSSISVPRASVKRYGHARVLTPGETTQLLDWLDTKRHTLNGSRNYALLLTFLLTGYRNDEVVSMRWGNIRPHRKVDGAFVFDWRGKGGKSKADPFPVLCHQAIVAHLALAERLPLAGDAYIWAPLQTGQLANLRNGGGKHRGHISGKSAQRILQSSLRWAGVKNWGQVRVHDLRHTFAHRFRKNDPDLEKLRERLNHESLATTGIYVREVLADPVDDWSVGVYQSLRED